MSRLALIAGAGALPALIAARQDQRPVVASLEGFVPDDLTPDITFRLEQLGSTLELLKAQDVSRLCLIGKVSRPTVDMARIDEVTRPLMPKLMEAMAQGDDGALRGLVAVLEDAGFGIVGAHELAHDLLPSAGALAGQPTKAQETDAARGFEVIDALGAADVGQACIVADGQAIAVEALPGTDWMMRSLLVPGAEVASDFTDPLGMASDWLTGPQTSAAKPKRDPELPQGGLLVKAPKPGQELRVDMPTIGPDTIARAAEVGLDGVVVRAGGVLVLDPERCKQIANDAGLLLWVHP